jgi:hypothetical protein
MVPFSEVQSMAVAAAKSGLFPGARTPEAALTLMLVAQAEGLHPVQALRRFHVIEGRPAMSAEAMLASFQAAGGRITWQRTDEAECAAVFEAPGMGAPLTVRWTLEDAKRAGVAGKQNWQRYPRQMLRARVVSEGVRASMPGVVLGMYTPEEVADFDTRPAPAERTPQPTTVATYAPPATIEDAGALRAMARDAVKRLMPMSANADRRAWVAKVLGRDPSAYELTADECHAVIDAVEAEATRKEVAHGDAA